MSAGAGPARNLIAGRGPWHLAGKAIFAAIFLVAGVGHFVASDFFLKVVPPYLPYPLTLVLVSGAIEILLGGLLLVPRTSRLAAWGLIALLIAVFPANIHVFQHQDKFPMPAILHLLRLPLQGVLILWAYAYARRPADGPAPMPPA